MIVYFIFSTTSYGLLYYMWKQTKSNKNKTFVYGTKSIIKTSLLPVF